MITNQMQKLINNNFLASQKSMKNEKIVVDNFCDSKYWENDYPKWYQEINSLQLKAANKLSESLNCDARQNRTRRTENCLQQIGLWPLAPALIIKKLMKISRCNDLTFLWFLMESFYKDSDHNYESEHIYNINEQLIMTCIAYLDLTMTLKGLETILLPFVQYKDANLLQIQLEEKLLSRLSSLQQSKDNDGQIVSCSAGNLRRVQTNKGGHEKKGRKVLSEVTLAKNNVSIKLKRLDDNSLCKWENEKAPKSILFTSKEHNNELSSSRENLKPFQGINVCRDQRKKILKKRKDRKRSKRITLANSSSSTSSLSSFSSLILSSLSFSSNSSLPLEKRSEPMKKSQPIFTMNNIRASISEPISAQFKKEKASGDKLNYPEVLNFGANIDDNLKLRRAVIEAIDEDVARLKGLENKENFSSDNFIDKLTQRALNIKNGNESFCNEMAKYYNPFHFDKHNVDLNDKDQHMIDMLAKALKYLAKDPVYILAGMPESYKHPILREWFQLRYDVCHCS